MEEFSEQDLAGFIGPVVRVGQPTLSNPCVGGHVHAEQQDCVAYLRRHGFDIASDQCCGCYFSGSSFEWVEEQADILIKRKAAKHIGR